MLKQDVGQHYTNTNFTLLEQGKINKMQLPSKAQVVVDASPILPVIVRILPVQLRSLESACLNLYETVTSHCTRDIHRRTITPNKEYETEHKT